MLALPDLIRFSRIQNLLATKSSVASVDKNLGLVEAQNFVPSIWAPGAEGASGATGYFGSSRSLEAGFVLGKGEREGKGREVMGQG
jgi:hypothetical protein